MCFYSFFKLLLECCVVVKRYFRNSPSNEGEFAACVVALLVLVSFQGCCADSIGLCDKSCQLRWFRRKLERGLSQPLKSPSELTFANASAEEHVKNRTHTHQLTWLNFGVIFSRWRCTRSDPTPVGIPGTQIAGVIFESLPNFFRLPIKSTATARNGNSAERTKRYPHIFGRAASRPWALDCPFQLVFTVGGRNPMQKIEFASATHDFTNWRAEFLAYFVYEYVLPAGWMCPKIFIGVDTTRRTGGPGGSSFLLGGDINLRKHPARNSQVTKSTSSHHLTWIINSTTCQHYNFSLFQKTVEKVSLTTIFAAVTCSQTSRDSK